MVKEATDGKLQKAVVTMSEEEVQQRIAERKKVRKQRRRQERRASGCVAARGDPAVDPESPDAPSPTAAG